MWYFCRTVQLLTDIYPHSFSTSGYWLSFINVDAFMRTLFSPEEQPRMQPALVYAGLALATLMKSSELELGAAGRTRAVWLRDAAQTNLEQSLANQWIDLPLAEAALVRRLPNRWIWAVR
jgi:hypothetical protein